MDQILFWFLSLSQDSCWLVSLRTLIWYSLTRESIFHAFYKLEYSCLILHAMCGNPIAAAHLASCYSKSYEVHVRFY
jgi:hypothetical protein